MNILIVSRPISPPWNEAGKNIVYGIVNNIMKHRFSLFVSDRKTKFSNKNINCNFVRSLSKSKFSSYLEISNFQRLNIFFHLLKKDPEIDVYHFFFTPHYLTSLYSRIVSRIKGKKTIQTLTTYSDKEEYNKTLIFADKVTVFSEHRKKQLEAKGFRNVVKVNIGIDTKKFCPADKDSALRSRFGIKKDELVVLYAGHYFLSGVTKNLANITKLIVSKYPKVKFIFACRKQSKKDTEHEMFLRKQFKMQGILGNIIFLNFFQDMPSLINLADVGIYPYDTVYPKFEIPMILLELLSQKKPVVVTDIPPQNEVLADKHVGIKVKKGDDETFADATVKLLKNEGLRKKLGEEGRKLIVEEYDIRKVAKDYERLYDSI